MNLNAAGSGALAKIPLPGWRGLSLERPNLSIAGPAELALDR